MKDKESSQKHTILRFKQRYGLIVTREEYWYLCNWISIHLMLTKIEGFIKSVKRRSHNLSIVEFAYKGHHVVALYNVQHGYILTVYPRNDVRFFDKDNNPKLHTKPNRHSDKIVCQHCKKLVPARDISKTVEGFRVCSKDIKYYETLAQSLLKEYNKKLLKNDPHFQ